MVSRMKRIGGTGGYSSSSSFSGGGGGTNNGEAAAAAAAVPTAAATWMMLRLWWLQLLPGLVVVMLVWNYHILLSSLTGITVATTPPSPPCHDNNYHYNNNHHQHLPHYHRGNKPLRGVIAVDDNNDNNHAEQPEEDVKELPNIVGTIVQVSRRTMAARYSAKRFQQLRRGGQLLQLQQQRPPPATGAAAAEPVSSSSSSSSSSLDVIVVGVLSAADQLSQRQAIRDTWGYGHTNVLFLVAGEWTEALAEEMIQHEDLVWFDHGEGYYQITWSVLAFINLAVTKIQHFRHLIKTDTDSYLRLEALESMSPSVHAGMDYAGSCLRQNEHLDYLQDGYYPDYAAGFGYQLSHAFAECISRHVTQIPILVIEDATIGFFAQFCRVPCVSLPNLHENEYFAGYVPPNTMLIHHRARTPELMASYHQVACTNHQQPRNGNCDEYLRRAATVTAAAAAADVPSAKNEDDETNNNNNSRNNSTTVSTAALVDVDGVERTAAAVVATTTTTKPASTAATTAAMDDQHHHHEQETTTATSTTTRAAGGELSQQHRGDNNKNTANSSG